LVLPVPWYTTIHNEANGRKGNDQAYDLFEFHFTHISDDGALLDPHNIDGADVTSCTYDCRGNS